MGEEAALAKEELDAGAAFVLVSKGTWLHAAYHLTTAIVGPAILSLPYAFASLGWELGVLALTMGALVTFYGYNLVSTLLEQADQRGQRHLRLGDLAVDILGPKWSKYVVFPQMVISFGIVVGSNLLCGQGMLKIYENLVKDGDLKLYHLVMISASIMIILSQLPSFHSLRYISLASALLSMGYSLGVVAACIYAGHSKRAPPKDYSIVGSTSARVFHAFNGLSIMASTYGVSIIPEIQATIASPVSGKMFKGLLLCYAVVVTTFFSVSISGYWAFGNKATGNLFDNFIPDDNTTLAPDWLLFLIILFIVIQLLAIAVVYSQPLFDVFETALSDVKRPIFSFRNLLPRLAVRSLYIVLAAFLAAMLPFFGDLNAFIGAVGFLPLAFILPPVLYNIKCKPSPGTVVFWVNTAIIVVYGAMAVMGSVSSVRQIVLDAHKFKVFSNNTS
ncbi:hypothetical protein SELMODRAFT_157684 [Selaginella moellendorffii]|uniref:Amino acid transporter transmembrane domain-containing protein n=1 Tax=Selaginella moellendorffii TaxID=88036 RepID=D8SRG3_SELML|nr:GABA transporter 1 [Selaginella moellendorffii]EFJ13044.1 hypothetical protein SELMODRAFT_157684 [Selaginella moellendorffii]|eukprot:XP_002985867.1 GABA transporter 1 [Selaginella moellendorffii]